MDEMMKLYMIEQIRNNLASDGVRIDRDDEKKMKEFLDRDMSIDELIDYFKSKDGDQ
ncbi:hypothetical protein [Salisediminibacterium selenitireducens]|uniref:Uncharacterized protein n=1 Tax=Bacillus selenitireducens (strain ATCC 700615 / DSM 15326 / MLS10) TaxID=439292 RepID=D6XTF0_BACIE|nr:hypothetical protein [Salisediminibacterium selenitireducens]ADH99086.1 hypothetical protein Bsel_1575 [[Bacillus] selenitireducens MLS10]